ncbi:MULTISPECIES: hypothetical protein [Acidithiobacillus]|uniref:Uncharacterized protein n=2 Tax=Acidithiobacillus TaxID=119977 RepID=A0A179BNM4_ACIFR|nr:MULTISPECIES: hypothetical protein [Acidithiobacillus]MEB8488172.1 hypothetical protein [Acidithiobacillus ferriphilus]MEB8488758.1 hypothetical protein [Acidithiobacillus ferriphilus]MEB8492202.1 hypothetical protein [Acidithiobacillus ferriphilus]MEB8513505.1 hypothetical protein [Acidithiobacillus ferriphilus]MEB8520685.1 hypothetical protein [Acidithiobacillus ferriphilus]
MNTTETHHTFWRQLGDHPELHAMEFALATALFALGGEAATYFRYSTVVLTLAALAGFITNKKWFS